MFLACFVSLVDIAIEQKITNFTSPEMLNELARVLRQKFKQPEEYIESQLASVANYSQITEPKIKANAVPEDPKDNMIIECALNADADYIITGDKHLLKLKEYKGIKILTPKEFLELVQSR